MAQGNYPIHHHAFIVTDSERDVNGSLKTDSKARFPTQMVGHYVTYSQMDGPDSAPAINRLKIVACSVYLIYIVRVDVLYCWFLMYCFSECAKTLPYAAFGRVLGVVDSILALISLFLKTQG